MDWIWFSVTIVDIGVLSFSLLGLFLLYRRCNALQKGNEKLHAENEELRQQLNAVQAENEELRQRLNAMEAENEELRQQQREFQSAADRRFNAVQAENG